LVQQRRTSHVIVRPQEMCMSMIRTFTMIAALGATTMAFAEPPKAPAQADKKADKPADKPAAKGDAKTDDKAGKREQLSQAIADKFVVFFDKLVEIAVANKDDCAKMATGVNAHVDANQPLLKDIADAKEQHKEPPQAMKDHVMKKTRDELQPALANCGQDKAVTAALMRLRAGPKPTK
jgi:hypothetical protein